MSLWKPTYQLRINGQNLYPGSGIEGKNRRLAVTTESYSGLNIVPGQNSCGFPGFNDVVEDAAHSRWQTTNWQQYEPFPRVGADTTDRAAMLGSSDHKSEL